MIDQKYREASERIDEALHYTQTLIISAWTVAVENNNSNDRLNNALLGLLSMAEDKLDEAMNAQQEAWSIVAEGRED